MPPEELPPTFPVAPVVVLPPIELPSVVLVVPPMPPSASFPGLLNFEEQAGRDAVRRTDRPRIECQKAFISDTQEGDECSGCLPKGHTRSLPSPPWRCSIFTHEHRRKPYPVNPRKNEKSQAVVPAHWRNSPPSSSCFRELREHSPSPRQRRHRLEHPRAQRFNGSSPSSLCMCRTTSGACRNRRIPTTISKAGKMHLTSTDRTGITVLPERPPRTSSHGSARLGQGGPRWALSSGAVSAGRWGAGYS